MHTHTRTRTIYFIYVFPRPMRMWWARVYIYDGPITRYYIIYYNILCIRVYYVGIRFAGRQTLLYY